MQGNELFSIITQTFIYCYNVSIEWEERNCHASLSPKFFTNKITDSSTPRKNTENNSYLQNTSRCSVITSSSFKSRRGWIERMLIKSQQELIFLNYISQIHF